MKGCDMIVALYHLPEEPELSGIRIKRSFVGDAEWFYRKTVGAEFIKGGTPENSVYSNLIRME